MTAIIFARIRIQRVIPLEGKEAEDRYNDRIIVFEEGNGLNVNYINATLPIYDSEGGDLLFQNLRYDMTKERVYFTIEHKVQMLKINETRRFLSKIHGEFDLTLVEFVSRIDWIERIERESEI